MNALKYTGPRPTRSQIEIVVTIVLFFTILSGHTTAEELANRGTLTRVRS